MKRRKFIKTAGVGAAGVAAVTTVAAPAIAQSMPEVKWRLTSSFPKSLDTLYGGSELFAKIIGEMSDGKFQVRAFAAGEIVPGLQVADAVQNGTVEAGQTAAYYYFGKHPNFVFETGLPFSMNQRQYYAWLEFGGGHELINEFYKEYNFRSLTFGGTGCQMGGWFRKEIKSMEDMKGLKFRVGGFAGLILTRLGVVPQQIAGGDIYPALEKGTTTRSSASTRSRSTTTTPAGGKAPRSARSTSTTMLGRSCPSPIRRWSRRPPAGSPPGWYRSTMPAIRRRCVASWRRAPSCGRSRAPSSST